MMIVSIGAYYRRVGWLKAFRLLSLCYIGNFRGPDLGPQVFSSEVAGKPCYFNKKQAGCIDRVE